MRLLEVRDLSFGYPHHPVGQGVSLVVDAGEVLCLLGPNGSGKTTLFKTVLGLLAPTAGEVLIGGERVARWTRGRFGRAVGYVPQAHGGLFPFTALEVVLMGRTAHLGAFGVPSRHDTDVGLRSLDTLGVGALAGRIYTELSGGERHLVLIARALAQEARLLVMDEPTASLDFGNQIRVLDKVRELRDQGMAVLMSTHQPNQALRVADRVALLKQGRLVADGPPASLITAERLGHLYDIPPARLADRGPGWLARGC